MRACMRARVPSFLLSLYIDVPLSLLLVRSVCISLDGGISLLVEGLLTYQVVDVERLIKGECEIGGGETRNSV